MGEVPLYSAGYCVSNTCTHSRASTSWISLEEARMSCFASRQVVAKACGYLGSLWVSVCI